MSKHQKLLQQIEMQRFNNFEFIVFFIIIDWYLGTAPREENILPSTLVSYGMATSAAIDAGALYIDRTIFATLSEVLALAEQKNPVVTDNLLSIEPGRTFYHTVEMCNVAHRCQEVVSSPGIIFRKSLISFKS